MPEIVTILSIGLVGTVLAAIAVYILGLFATTVLSVGAAFGAERAKHPGHGHHAGRMALHH